MKKKLIIIFIIAGFFMQSCGVKENDKSDPTAPCVGVPAFPELDPSIPAEKVRKMAEMYQARIKLYDTLVISQINLDVKTLLNHYGGYTGLTLISAADTVSGIPTIIMQAWKPKLTINNNLNDYFSINMEGMQCRLMLCPPPDSCDKYFGKSANPEDFKEDRVQEMVATYRKFVKEDRTRAIRQINIDVALLKIILEGSKGLKLIAAADEANNSVTVILQIWKDNKYHYYDIRKIFNYAHVGMRNRLPLCPPPDGCDQYFLGDEMKSKIDSVK